MPTILDARQALLRSALGMVGSAANDTLDTILTKIDAELAKLFEDRNIMISDGGIITFTGTQVQFTEALKITLNQKISGAAPMVIDLGSANVALATSGTMFWAVINRTAGTATTATGTTMPSATSANQEVFLIAKRVDATDGTQRVYWRNGMAQDAGQSNRLGASGSGDGGSGTLQVVPGYKLLINDSFSSTTAAESTVDTTFTKATYDASKKLYRLLCDKTKTVSTNTGTALTVNLAPSFTVQIGDIAYVTSGARSGQWRRIAAVTNQTTYTLDAAFTGGDAAAADTLTISQAVWTQDLVNFGSATELTRARDFYPAADVNNILVDYADSLAASDDVADFTQTARIVMSASNQGLQAAVTYPTTDTFTSGIYTRPNAPSQINSYSLLVNTDNERLFLVFFCNPSNASVTAGANLLDYAVNFYEEAAAINGGVLASAYGLSDNSSTTYNGTISTVSSLTRFDLNFDVSNAADPGGVGSQVKVTVDGQDVPKFVSSGVNPSTQLSYTIALDANGLYRRIQFNANLSVTPVDIMVMKQFGVYDGSFTQTNKLIGLYDAIVGSAAQVTAGTATHSSLQAAHDALAAGSNILVLNNVTLSGSPTLSKRLMIQGKGPGSVLTGNLIIASGALGSIIKWLKVAGNVTFSASADKCFMTECYMTGTFSNDISNLENTIDITTE